MRFSSWNGISYTNAKCYETFHSDMNYELEGIEYVLSMSCGIENVMSL